MKSYENIGKNYFNIQEGVDYFNDYFNDYFG